MLDAIFPIVGGTRDPLTGQVTLYRMMPPLLLYSLAALAAVLIVRR